MKDGDIELLTEIANFENSVDIEKEFKIGWAWRHVRIWPATLSRLFKTVTWKMCSVLTLIPGIG